jgi:hypothetical protein
MPMKAALPEIVKSGAFAYFSLAEVKANIYQPQNATTPTAAKQQNITQRLTRFGLRMENKRKKNEDVKSEAEEVVKKRSCVDTSPSPAEGSNISTICPIEKLTRRKNTGFLDLPGELRNEIVNLAMPKGRIVYLKKRQTGLSFWDSIEGGKPVNQIRNTCKQLRAEMSGIECQFNHVVSEGPLFYDLIRGWNSSQKSLLGEITLLPLKKEFFNVQKPVEHVLHTFIDLCLENQWITLDIGLGHWNFQPQQFSTFLLVPTVILKALRGTGDVFTSSGHEMIRKWQRGKDVDQLNANNLRFFPRDTELDTKRLRRAYEKSMYKGRIFEVFGAENANEFIQVVRGWHTNGV